MVRNGLTAASSLASARGTAGAGVADMDMDTAVAATDTDVADTPTAHVVLPDVQATAVE